MFATLKSRKDVRRRSKFQPSIDGLEKREVLTGTPVVNRVAGLIQIIPAADQDNTATLSQVGDQLNVDINGQDWYFDAAQIQQVVFDASGAGAGTHQTWINETSVVSTAYAGAGQNHFVAGHSVDVFLAWQGANTIDARDGHVIYLGFGPAADTTFNDGTGSGLILLFDGAGVRRTGSSSAYVALAM